MAWTTPRTWVTGEVVTASLLNLHLRDQLLALDQHAHGGAGGAGNDIIGNLTRATFTDGGDPSAPGAGLTAFYTKSGAPFYIAGAGGSAIGIALDSHSHSLSEADTGEGVSAGTNSENPTVFASVSSSGGTLTATDSTVSLSEKTLIAAFGSMIFGGATGDGFDVDLTINSVSVDSIEDLTSGSTKLVLKGSREESSGVIPVTITATNQSSSAQNCVVMVGFVAVQL